MPIQTLVYAETQLIFRQEDGLLHVPDANAALLWQIMRSGLDAKTICTELASVEEQTACTEKMRQLHTYWQTQGLLEQASLNPANGYTLIIQPALEPIAIYTDEVDIYQYARRLYQACQIDTNAEIAAHLQILSDANDHYQLSVNGVLKHVGIDKHKALIALCYEIGELATHEAPRLLVFHAAAVAYAGQVLLMPAQAGQGKTTLTATLLQHQAKLINDDIVPLNHDGTVTAINQPLKIKSGAWDILEQLYPDLLGLPSVLRQDGIVMKHVSLPMARLCMAGSCHRVTGIVVPEFKSAPTIPTLERLSPTQTLQHLLAAEPFFPHKLTRTYLQSLLNWLQPLPGYKITYGNSQDALAMLDGICQELPSHVE